ncbi:hypothetical protein, partial [Klebsiella pneumoniae]|uniref:hypothetical protein n=1 Tax=Klebsiella pneumoniae TaxID=573 RepID=UPI001D0EFFE9
MKKQVRRIMIKVMVSEGIGPHIGKEILTRKCQVTEERDDQGGMELIMGHLDLERVDQYHHQITANGV